MVSETPPVGTIAIVKCEEWYDDPLFYWVVDTKKQP